MYLGYSKFFSDWVSSASITHQHWGEVALILNALIFYIRLPRWEGKTEKVNLWGNWKLGSVQNCCCERSGDSTR